MPRQDYRFLSTRTDRIFNLSDGVFSIAMTLLVFGLVVPVLEPGGPTLAQALLGMWQEFLLYGLSFLILGVLWIMHHAVYDNLKHSDHMLLWLNILALLFVALLPFSTSLIWRHGANRVTALTYGANFLGGAVFMWGMFCYGSGKEVLLKPGVDPRVIRAGRRMGLAYTVILLIAIGLAFVIPLASFAMYAAFVVAFIVFTMLGRFDVVMLWPAARTRRERGGPTSNGADRPEEGTKR
ncbi:MAG: DUF1211 domain-containing protein [Candidatus Bipolaricaulota bacterium]|nr:MAG: DUF1211 domain-containing protein [Candidatus Bipolaricaulota bacterium]